MERDIKTVLLKSAENGYKVFSASLIPNVNNVLGVRLPVLRKIAGDIYKKGGYEDFLKQREFEYFEETMLQGMLIGMLKLPAKEMLGYVKDFVPLIDNWSVCDCFCSGLKFTRDNMAMVWEFLQPYFSSNKEYDLRFAFVMLLSYFVDDEYIDWVLEKIDDFEDDGYYSKMAVAWLISVCFVKEREKTILYLKRSKLSKWTFNKGIQKIGESLRVTKADKALCRRLKK